MRFDCKLMISFFMLNMVLFLIATAMAVSPFPAEIDVRHLPQHYLLKDSGDIVYLSLKVFIDACGFKTVRYEKGSKSLLLSDPLPVRLRVGDTWINVNDVPIVLVAPVLLVSEEVFVPALSFAAAIGTTVNLPDLTFVRHVDDIERVRAIHGRDQEYVFTTGKFFRRLIRKRIVTKEDVCRAVAIFIECQEAPVPFPELIVALKEADIIPIGWTFDRDDPADRGFACYLFVRALDLKGGLVTRMFGLSGRTAYRVAVDFGLSPPAGHRSLINGGELMAIMSKASGLRDEISAEGKTR